ncbi:MAG: V-type ATP synthase subunit F [Clostridia bacterium]|nr:V-type ATP synthase subunit F [Clostridia bacterium]
MKYFLISDNTDSAAGLRLAGIEGVVTTDRGTAKEALSAAASDPAVGIILVTEKLWDTLGDEISKIRDASRGVLIVGIPDRHGGGGSGEDMLRYVRDTVGIEL